MKTIALVELLWDGHHSTYFKYYIRSFLEQGYRVLGFCPQPQDVQNWLTDEGPQYSDQVQLFSIQEPKSLTLPVRRLSNVVKIFNYWYQVSCHLRQATKITGYTPNLIFFSWIDLYLGAFIYPFIIDLIFPYPWTGLLFQPQGLRIKSSFHLFRCGPASPYVALKSSNCSAIAVLDEGIAEPLSKKLKYKPIIPFPDIADGVSPDFQYPPLKEIKEKARGRKIIGLLGSLGRRKGFLTLLKIAQVTTDRDWFFLFAGKTPLLEPTLSQEREMIKSFIKSNPDNCYFSLGFIPGEPQFNALVDICDVLYVVYENYPFSSNLLTKAAIFEKYVIANCAHCIGERVQNYRMGEVVVQQNVEQSIEALDRLINGKKCDTSTHLRPDFKEYREEHSEDRLFKKTAELIKICID